MFAVVWSKNKPGSESSVGLSWSIEYSCNGISPACLYGNAETALPSIPDKGDVVAVNELVYTVQSRRWAFTKPNKLKITVYLTIAELGIDYV
jgi:hypothetical protein